MRNSWQVTVKANSSKSIHLDTCASYDYNFFAWRGNAIGGYSCPNPTVSLAISSEKVGDFESKTDVLDGESKLMFEACVILVRRKIDAVEACVALG